MAPHKAGPLELLAQALGQAAPPSLSGLQTWFEQGEEYREFVLLVREYLADFEAEILAQIGVGAQVAAFARRFRERYFPLPDPFTEGWMEEYSDLLFGIPIIRMGIDYDDYHSMPDSWRRGYQLLAVLSEDPYEHYGGGSVALLEACAQIVPRELLESIAEPFSREVLHQRLDDTRFDGAALMADWISLDTGNAFLDVTNEDPIEAPWDPETVEMATTEWSEAHDITDRIHSLAEWIEVDPPSRFKELLEFIESREGVGKEKEDDQSETQGHPPGQRRREGEDLPGGAGVEPSEGAEGRGEGA